MGCPHFRFMAIKSDEVPRSQIFRKQRGGAQADSIAVAGDQSAMRERIYEDLRGEIRDGSFATNRAGAGTNTGDKPCLGAAKQS